MQRNSLAIEFLYLCNKTAYSMTHRGHSWWVWIAFIHSLLVKNHSLCVYPTPLVLSCVSTALAKRRYPSTSKSFPRTSPVRPSTHDATTLHNFLDSTSRTIPDQDPFKHFFHMLVVTFNNSHDPGPAFVCRLAHQGHWAQSPWKAFSQTLPSLRTLHSPPVPILNQQIPVTLQVSAYMSHPEKSPLSWASLSMSALSSVLWKYTLLLNSCRKVC